MLTRKGKVIKIIRNKVNHGTTIPLHKMEEAKNYITGVLEEWANNREIQNTKSLYNSLVEILELTALTKKLQQIRRALLIK